MKYLGNKNLYLVSIYTVCTKWVTETNRELFHSYLVVIYSLGLVNILLNFTKIC